MAENVVHSIVARRVINKSENLAICPSDDIVTSQILNKQFCLMTSYYMSFAGREKLVFSHLFLLLYPSSSTKEFLVQAKDSFSRIRLLLLLPDLNRFQKLLDLAVVG